MATTEVVPEIKQIERKSYWKVAEATHDLEQVLNALRAERYHVQHIFPGPTHYTIVAHDATYQYDIPKIRKNTGEILALMKQEIAKKKK